METINLCIAHQKSIVDDVLSFSKLDSAMLTLSPKPTQPDRQIRMSLRMLQPEFRKKGCRFEYAVEEGYTALNIDWVMADVHRISQVVINLMTNAIKFTCRDDGEKLITCRLSASRERPDSYPPDVVFFKTESKWRPIDATNKPEWTDGDPLYIMVAVKDSGIGISDEAQYVCSRVEPFLLIS